MGKQAEQAALARKIPDAYLPFAEQSMLNMALKGIQIIVGSHNISPSLIEQGKRINEEYTKALIAARNQGKPKTKADPVTTTPPLIMGKPSDMKPRTTSTSQRVQFPDIAAPTMQDVIDSTAEPVKKPPRKRTTKARSNS